MAQIRIDEEVYNRLKEAADFNKRTVGQHILFLLDNEITFNEIRGMLKNKTENLEKIVSPAAKNQRPSGEHRLVATGNREMPVRESLPDDLEEAVQTAMRIKQELRPEALQAWCRKMAVDEAWTDEQCQYEVKKHKDELESELESVMVVLREHNVNIGM